MIGQNELHLCHAEMVRAMQMYLDATFKDPPTVVRVVRPDHMNEFVIELAPAEEKGK